MAAYSGTIITTGCNVCWNSGGAGQELAEFMIGSTDRIYIGNQASTLSRKSFDYFDGDDILDENGAIMEGKNDTYSFRFGGWLVKKNNGNAYAGFVAYQRTDKGVKHITNYIDIRTTQYGSIEYTIMKGIEFIENQEPDVGY